MTLSSRPTTHRPRGEGMAGTGDEDEDKGEGRPRGDDGDGAECSFVWDDQSQLYYHASSGFYHDPSAGWYYSTRDGRYYRFEDGHYITWDSDEKNENQQQSTDNAFENASQDNAGSAPVSIDEGIENPPPPSEWLEETLINLYLSGYSNELTDAGCSSAFEADAGTHEEHHNEKNFDEEDAMDIVEEVVEEAESSGRPFEEDTSRCEENWLAQYGQVVKPEDEAALAFPVVDLWEWRLVEEIGKRRKKIMRLVGRLAKRSVKLHPSVSAGGGFLKTARICEAYLDLVQVETGKIYRLRSPSAEYLSSLSTYDSSDPTKDWCFPRLNTESLSLRAATGTGPGESSNSIRHKDSSATSLQADPTFSKNNRQKYRDRAAERRALHGSVGIGTKQNNSLNDAADEGDMFSESSHAEESGAEGANPFGGQSYGRRVLESMGWKEGEAIGRTNKGLLEPLQVAGNKGTAGLGWSTERVVQ